MSAAIPTGTIGEVLSELRTRAAVAETLMTQAQALGDDAGFNAAFERHVLRLKQIRYVEARPMKALCPTCQFGEESWPQILVNEPRPVWSCLQHWTPTLEREAAEQAQIERQAP